MKTKSLCYKTIDDYEKKKKTQLRFKIKTAALRARHLMSCR